MPKPAFKTRWMHQLAGRTAVRICVACAAAFAAIAPTGGCGWLSSAEKASTGAQSKDKSRKEDLPAVRAEIRSVSLTSWPTIVRSQGSLVADEVAEVGVKVAGRVSQVHVDLGNQVETGQPLATLDQNEFKLDVSRAEAQLAQARAAVGLKADDPLESLNADNAPPVRQARAVWEEAKIKLDRGKQLHNRNAVTQAEYDQVVAAERVAEAMFASAVNSVREKIALIGVESAQLLLARQRLEDTVVRAPFDGLVQQRHVAPGTYVQAGDAIATVIANKTLRFRGTIPERYAQQLQLGDEVRLHVESLGEPRVAKVTRISPTLDSLSRALLYEAQIDNSDCLLRAGLFGEAEVVLDAEARATAIPESAIAEFAGVEKVWRVADGILAEQVVQTGQRRGNEVEILSGLAVGDQILLDAREGRAGRIDTGSVSGQPQTSEAAGEGSPKRASNQAEGAGGVLAR
jgi:RND family efflux transporter MFP subunit